MEDILTDGNVTEFISGIKQTDISLWKKIKQWFQNLIGDLKATVEAYKGYSPESTEGKAVSNMQEIIKNLEALFGQGLLDASDNYQAAKNGAEVKENITTDSDVTSKMQLRNVNGKDVVWIEDTGITNAQLNDYKFVANYIADHIGEVYKIIESGQSVYIDEDLPGEFTQSKYTNSLLKNRRVLLKAKNKSISNLGEIIETAKNRRWEKTKHTETKDAKYGMYRYDVRFGFSAKNTNGDVVGANVYNAEILIRNASDGKKYLYDVVDIKKDTATSDWLTQRVTRAADHSTAQKSNVFTENIPQQSAEVKEKFHLREASVSSDIDESLTMQEAKQMIQRTFVICNIKEWTAVTGVAISH